MRKIGALRKFVVVVLAILLVTAGVLQLAQAAPGDLDTGFGNAGKVRTDFSGNIDQANAIAIQPDGKIVAAGSSFSNAKTVEDFIVARYNANGSLDKRFGNNGKITTDFFRNVDSISSIAIQPDGKIVVAGFAQLPGSGGTARVFALARYSSDGRPDTGFGSGGLLTTNFGGNFASASAIMLQPDGKIVVAGTADFNPRVPGSGLDFALARYQANGSLDGSFGDAGKVVFDFFGSFDQANAAVLQPHGNIIVVGSASFDSTNRDIGFALARFTPEGDSDFTFGSGGKQITDFFNGAKANDVVLLPDGRFVVAGTASNNATRPVATDFALACYNSNGHLDSSFGIGGKSSVPFSDSATEQANAMVLAPDGKIVVAGAAFKTFATPPDFAIRRYNSDGSIDTNFGDAGAVTTDFAGGTDIAQAVAIQADGNVVVAGRAFRNDFDLALARYENDVAPVADAIPPTAPTNLAADFNASTNAIDLSWIAATDNVAVSGYRVFRDGGTAPISTVTGITFSDKGQSGTHSYAVAAIDGAGNQSELSNIATVTVPSPDITPPAAPEDLVATASSSTTIELSWSAATDDVGVIGYEVFRDGGAVAIGTSTGTTFSDIGLDPDSTHSYAVAAVDAAGNRSALSNTASATTLPAPPADVTPPLAPTNLSATVNANAINLSWTASTDDVGVAGYRIFRDGGATPIGTVTGTTFSDLGQSGTHSYAVTAIDAAGNQSGPSNTVTATVPVVAQVVLASLSLNPTRVTAPATSTGTITLSGAAPAGGLSVTLRSDETRKATVPAAVTVAEGATSATFIIETLTGRLGGGDNRVTISATLNGTTRSATLSIERP